MIGALFLLFAALDADVTAPPHNVVVAGQVAPARVAPMPPATVEV